MKKSHQYAIWILVSIVGVVILIWGINVKKEKTNAATALACCNGGRRLLKLENPRHRFLMESDYCDGVVCDESSAVSK